MTLFYGIYTFLSLSKDDLSQTCHLINKGVSILAPHDMGSFIHLGFKYVAHIFVQTCQRPLNEGLSHVYLVLMSDWRPTVKGIRKYFFDVMMLNVCIMDVMRPNITN